MKSLNVVTGAVLAAGMFAPLSAHALTVTVDCKAGTTITGNGVTGSFAGSGINLAFDSTLMLQPPVTNATGNGGLGLYCNDE